MALDAQQMHDQLMARRSRQRAIKSKNNLPDNPVINSKVTFIDPISAVCANNPGLTRERAVEIAEAFGF